MNKISVRVWVCLIASMTASLMCAPFSSAAPCEQRVSGFFPHLGLYSLGNAVYLYPEWEYEPRYKIDGGYNTESGEQIGGGFILTGNGELVKAGTDEIRELMRNGERQKKYLKVGDTIKYMNSDYTVLKFGIKKASGGKEKIFKITGISHGMIANMTGYDFLEYMHPDAINPDLIYSVISVAMIVGDKVVAGFGGGFAEGMGDPGGIATFDLRTNKWDVIWPKDLIDLYINDVILTSSDIVWFATERPEEFGGPPTGIFEFKIKDKTLKKVHLFDGMERIWRITRGGNYFIGETPNSVFIFDLTMKTFHQYAWVLDVGIDGEQIVPALVDCSRESCAEIDQYRRINFLFISDVFKIERKKEFLLWALKSWHREVEDFDYLNAYCDHGLNDAPQGFEEYVDIERVLLASDSRTNQFVWKTVTALIKASGKTSQYMPLIISAANDPDEWVRRLALEAAKDLGLIAE